jgi:hypothetical protein
VACRADVTIAACRRDVPVQIEVRVSPTTYRRLVWRGQKEVEEKYSPHVSSPGFRTVQKSTSAAIHNCFKVIFRPARTLSFALGTGGCRFNCRRRTAISSERDVVSICARLVTTGPSPRDVPGLLDAARDGFDLLAVVCRQCEGRSAGLFTAFAFASAAAAAGRRCIIAAPSLPTPSGVATGRATIVKGDLETVADTLADLALALRAGLSSLTCHAHDPGDRAACSDAARHADQIYDLLARNSR